MKSPDSLFSKFKTSLYKNYGENPGKMLVHTGVLGWVLSSAAQVGAILINDKIPKEQKSFLIPQEIADAGINILSFYLITTSFKNFAKKLVSCGKLTTKGIKNFLQKNNLTEKIGKSDFNIEKLDNFKQIKDEYKPFINGVDVLASVTGSIISCNIVTPILRNKYASIRQKQINAKFNENQVQTKGYNYQMFPRVSMSDFQSRLKI